MIAQILGILNIIFAVTFILCYAYQVVFIVISFFAKPKSYPETDKRYRYAVLICARNEEDVIDQLCDSIRAQNYPEELIDIYVIADNCTDRTKEVAQSRGATVFERKNDEQIGKGYALTELFSHIGETVGFDAYDGYFVVDADNILDPDYVGEMNKCYAAGERLVVGYRNSKNFADNWISSGYSIWFLRESRQLNRVRSALGLCSEIKGTGFLIHKDIIKRQGGWIHHLLIEDIQFEIENLLLGEKVAYCDAAIFYDEQPTGFKTSWWQRIRWCRGYFQILRHYSSKLFGAFVRGKGFSNYDLLMTISPAFFISLALVFVNVVGLVLTLIIEPHAFLGALAASLITAAGAYLLFALVGTLTLICERKRVHVSVPRQIWALVTFPIFMATYILIAAAAIFSKNKWRPIKHKRVDESSEIPVPEKREETEEKELETANK